jgi:hypothetical protein
MPIRPSVAHFYKYLVLLQLSARDCILCVRLTTSPPSVSRMWEPGRLTTYGPLTGINLSLLFYLPGSRTEKNYQLRVSDATDFG